MNNAPKLIEIKAYLFENKKLENFSNKRKTHTQMHFTSNLFSF
jgi:hypothetical protein